jgi:hypothetical protein
MVTGLPTSFATFALIVGAAMKAIENGGTLKA